MSISSLEVIKDRILTAKESSKIALFRVQRKKQVVIDCVFESIYSTQERIRDGDSKYIGSYYGKQGVIDAVSDIQRLF